MIQITKEESVALRNKFGNDVCIAITNRNKRGGRKRYYAEETSRVRYFIERMRYASEATRRSGKGGLN